MLLFQAEQNPEGSTDGNVLKLILDRLPDGRLGVEPGEMSVDREGNFEFTNPDGVFQGMTYQELIAGLSEALINEHDDVTPVSPCLNFADNQPQSNSGGEAAVILTGSKM